jgi:hypothetical protein
VPDEFSVIEYLPDGTYQFICRWVDAETAVKTAKKCTLKPAAQIGVIQRVLIIDGGDFACFEWRYGEGITFPTPEERGMK